MKFLVPPLCLLFFFLSIGLNDENYKAQLLSKTFSETVFEDELLLDSSVLGTKTIASNLDVPWEICWGPDNWIWYTEQVGTVSKVNPLTGEKKLLLKIPGVLRKGSYGLLGMAVHPLLFLIR